MKTNLLYYFIKEETRLHMSLTNSKNYYSYPFMLIVFFAIITVFSNYFFQELNFQTISLYTLNILFIGGILSGTFGLYARDFLERRFGDFGKLFQNALLQPISLNKIFLYNALADMFFYLFWFILPLMIGFSLGLFEIGENVLQVLFLAISGFFIFISGLLTSFILSVIYERNKVFFISILTILVILSSYFLLNFNLYEISPIHIFYLQNTLLSFIISILLIVTLTFLAYFSVGREFKTKVHKSKEKKSIKFNKKLSPYFTKDYIDMKRTGDIIGKPLFNVFIPSVLVLIMFLNSKEFQLYNLGTTFFAIIIGTLGTQMLNSLINSDSINYYKHLPSTLKNFIKPKIQLSLIICFIESIIILAIYSYYINDFSNLLQALIITLALLIYNFNLSFYLTGLSPNQNLMHTSIFLKYFFLLVPMLILIVIISILFNSSIIYTLGFLTLTLILSKLYFNLGLKKWETRE